MICVRGPAASHGVVHVKMTSILAPTLFVLGCGDTGVTKHNAEPTATITSHADGDTVREGEEETLRGVIGDTDGDPDELTFSWYVGGTSVCEDTVPDDYGMVTCIHSFGAGDGEVVLEVSDAAGATASDRVTLDVQPTDAPTAVITSPEAAGVYYEGQLITFAGLIGDAEDAAAALDVVWETDALGELPLSVSVTSEGEVEAFGDLSEGEHAVRLVVTDTSGKQATDSVVIDVGPPNTAPSCAITAPADGDAGPLGEEVRFEGTVADVDVPADWLAVTWESDVDGVLRESTPSTGGEVAFAYSDLSIATHTITMTVADEVGETCTDFILYTVGTAPTLSVTAPTSGSVVNDGDSVTFVGTVSDGEDLPTEVALSWSSDVDGEFSTQGADSGGNVSFGTRDLSAGDHAITVRATDTDGLYAQVTLDLTVNELPTAPTVTIEPDPAVTTVDLVASAAASVDPDGSGTVTFTYAWYEDGAASGASTSARFPFASTTKHSTYRVVVTPSDGDGDGPSGEAEVTVINSAPVLSSVVISPGSASVGDVLTCAATATDADLDAVTLAYAWSDGSTGPTYGVDASDVPGTVLTCTVTASDGDGGVDVGMTSVTVTNEPPVLGGVTIAPATGRVGDVLTCAASATDADGDVPTITYAWSSGGSGPLYIVAVTDDPGDMLICTATATDLAGATDVDTATATVLNTDPVLSAVSVTPALATAGEVLTCSATATDADGGSPAVTYAWSSGATGATYTVSASDGPGDVIVCTATATDVDGGVDVGTGSATVLNSGPTLTDVTVTPSTARVGETLTCSATATDPDGGTPSISYAWSDGSSGSTYTLDVDDDPGEVIVCTATASDGDGGADIGTDSATVLNTEPVLASVALTPDPATAADTLLCTPGPTSDADGEAVSTAIAWEVGGSLTGDSGATLAAPARGTSVVCVVTPWDATGPGTAVRSNTVVIDDTAPAAVDVAIEPLPAVIGEVLTCTWTYSDLDGDPDLSSLEWLVEGVSVSTSETWVAAGTAGDTVVCRVTPFDGTLEGAPAEASTVLEAAPTDTMQTGLLLSEWNASTVHAWDPLTGIDTIYQSSRSNDADCNVDEGRTDGWLVEHYDDHVLTFTPGAGSGDTVVVNTPYAYPKHVAVVGGNVLVTSRNDAILYLYSGAGAVLDTVSTGYAEGQGVATDGSFIYHSVWDGSAAHLLRYDLALNYLGEIALPTGMTYGNLVDLAYDRRTGLWYGMDALGEGGTGTNTTVVIEFEMGGAVTSTTTLYYNIDGLGVLACP